MNTEFIQRGGTSVKKHGGKLIHGLNAAAIIWLFATFVSKEDYRDHCKRCEIHITQIEFERERAAATESRAAIWRKVQDIDIKLDRLVMRSPHDVSLVGTNTVESGSN